MSLASDIINLIIAGLKERTPDYLNWVFEVEPLRGEIVISARIVAGPMDGMTYTICLDSLILHDLEMESKYGNGGRLIDAIIDEYSFRVNKELGDFMVNSYSKIADRYTPHAHTISYEGLTSSRYTVGSPVSAKVPVNRPKDGDEAIPRHVRRLKIDG